MTSNLTKVSIMANAFLTLKHRLWLRLVSAFLLSLFTASCNNSSLVPESSKPLHLFLPSFIDDEKINNGANFTCQLADNERFKEEVTRIVNAIRDQATYCGDELMSASPALKWNQKLLYSAYNNSYELAGSNVISHTSIDGKELRDKFKLSPYEFSIALENITVGPTTLTSAIQAWKTSPKHCQSMMNKQISEVAVACVYKEKSFYKYYWTMHLGAPIAPKNKIKSVNRLDSDRNKKN